MGKDYATMEIGKKCSRCKERDAVVMLSVKDKIKGLPVEKLIPACKQCCDETGVKIPT